MNRLSYFKQTRRYRSSGIAPACWDSPPVGRQSGFSLIESLVTLTILSIGLMGLAFLQAQGMQLNTSAYARTQASVLVGDIIDRMRLNSANAADYDTGSFSPGSSPASNCTITGAPDADNDRYCWYGRLQSALPEGDGAISVNGNVVTVTVSWSERPGATQDDDFDPASLQETDLVQNMSMSVTL
ncbi:MAG: type IV pilus modification protein PilV [Gammaproteobacteria bacterium]|nr:type IV pilus modification protein PilV [Gammaproteobacteria bacterium]